ncbi:hypothetical protein G9P44_002555 [Scheffersomyces stipitis]|nr:hypothetical protein G9P44_002555 [Scheffersomyces stipitis]
MSYRRKDRRSNGGLLGDDSVKESDSWSIPSSKWKPSASFGTVKNLKLNLKPLLSKQNWESLKRVAQNIDLRYFFIMSLVWLISIQFWERIYVHSVISSCSWNKWENWDKQAQPHRIALVADPQIIDASSYRGRPAIVDFFVRKVTDNYLHRNYQYIQHVLDPDTTVFLGDLFDGGREWKDIEWFKEYQRFTKIFPSKVNRRTISSIPGNHDIGFEDIDMHVLQRFSMYNGELNQVIEMGNHSLVLVDTISYSSVDPEVRKEPLQFLSELNSHLNPNYPRIMLSHVPMYRDPNMQPCGPLRENQKPFPIAKGKQYQTVLEREPTNELLSIVRPVVAFAGDDHDYCDVRIYYQSIGKDGQTLVPTTVRDITVKSAAMSAGIKYPAIQLLSLYNPQDARSDLELESKSSFNTQMCYMPRPFLALKFHGLVFAILTTYLSLKYIFKKEGQVILSIYKKKIATYDSYLPTAEKRHLSASANESIRGKEFSSFALHLALTAIVPLILIEMYYTSI